MYVLELLIIYFLKIVLILLIFIFPFQNQLNRKFAPIKKARFPSLYEFPAPVLNEDKSRNSFYSEPIPHNFDSDIDSGLTRSLETGKWKFVKNKVTQNQSIELQYIDMRTISNTNDNDKLSYKFENKSAIIFKIETTN